MNPERFRRAKELFLASVDLSVEERIPFLAEACAGDSEMEREVRTLLGVVETSTRSLTGSVQEAVRSLSGAPAEGESPAGGAGRIGPWELLGELGRGGMGTVHRARRADGAHEREVALKVIRGGLESRPVVQRFRSERRILAGLSHPNIASLLDAGSTDDGIPYLVMEKVDGVPIDRYCDEHLLSTRARLSLFLVVCDAVRHAHANLVVHRDLKPGNIHVTAEGVPKLLDFGLAKLLEPDPTGVDRDATVTQLRMLTPAYASPEQIRGGAITTASDVYSLGVLLYLLLTGHHPYGSSATPFDPIAAVLDMREPGRPSEAVGRTEQILKGGEPLTLSPVSVSAVRDGSPESLRRELAGDLDAIVLKALRKEPSRRYASAEELAGDIRRHLAGLPVSARRGTFTYRAGKFARRHWASLAAALLVLATLLGGIVSTNRQRALAERRFKEVRTLANSLLFELHDAIQDLPGATKARELVVRRGLEYLDRLSRDAGNDVSLRRELAEAYQKVGDVQGNPYRSNLGDTTGARTSYAKGVALLEPLVRSPLADDETRRVLSGLYIVQSGLLASTGETKEATERGARAVELRKEILEAKPRDEERMRGLAFANQVAAFAFVADRRPSEAVAALRRQSDLLRDLLTRHPQDAELRRSLGLNLNVSGDAREAAGDLEGAGTAYRQSVEVQRALVAEYPRNVRFLRELAYALNNLGTNRGQAGDTAAALAAHREALERREKLSADDPRDAEGRLNVAISRLNVGGAELKTGDARHALASFASARQLLEPIVEADPANVFARSVLANLYANTGSATAMLGPKAREDACGWFRKGVAAFEALEKGPGLPPIRVPEYDQAKALLAPCGSQAAAVAGRP